MLRLLTRVPPRSSKVFRVVTVAQKSSNSRAMATGKKENEELKASKLFDFSGFSTVVTGGGTGIGLMISTEPRSILELPANKKNGVQPRLWWPMARKCTLPDDELKLLIR